MPKLKAAEGFDAVIVGAGPAGATAAMTLAQAGRRVCVLDAAKFPRPRPCAGWVSASAAEWLSPLGLSLSKLAEHDLTNVRFWNSDFTKSATPRFKGTPAFLVDRASFDQALVKKAIKDGADVRQQWEVADMDIAEQQVSVISVDGRRISGRLLIYATGRDTRLLDRLGLNQEWSGESAWVASVEQVGSRSTDPRLSIAMGLDPMGGFGAILSRDRVSFVSVHLWGEAKDVVPTLVAVCRGAHRASILDKDLSDKAATAAVTRVPAGVALTMDTHVGKHTLIIGDAGGFVAAVSGEGIYPGMRSGKIAAEVVHKALNAPSPQDVLMEFNGNWRRAMAEYLRPPNTDTQYILPLIFSNQPMADRIGAAFFLGENI